MIIEAAAKLQIEKEITLEFHLNWTKNLHKLFFFFFGWCSGDPLNEHKQYCTSSGNIIKFQEPKN